MGKLSKREKALLIILVVFGSLALSMMYVITPSLNTLTEKRLLVQSLDQQKTEIQTSIKKLPDIEQQLKDLKNKSEGLSSTLNMMKSYETSLLFSNLYKKHNITPISLDISDYQAADLVTTNTASGTSAGSSPASSASPSGSSPSPSGSSAPAASSDTSAGGNKEKDDLSDQTVLKKVVTAQFSGKWSDVLAFIDDLNATSPSLIIQKFEMTNRADNQSVYNLEVDVYEFRNPTSDKS